MNRCGERRIAGLGGRTLDENTFVGERFEAAIEDAFHAVRLAGAGAWVDAPRSDQPAQGQGSDDERQPAERRDLPVRCAPPAHAGRDIGAGSIHARHGSSSAHRWSEVVPTSPAVLWDSAGEGPSQRTASSACVRAVRRPKSKTSGARASPNAAAAMASANVSTVNTPKLVRPELASDSGTAQYHISMDRYVATIQALVIAATPSVKPTIEVIPSQPRSFHVWRSEL